MSIQPGETEQVPMAAIVAEGGTAAPRRICEARIAMLPVSRAAATMMAGPDRQEPIFAHRAWPAHPLHLAPIHAETRRWLAPLELSDDTEQAFVRAVDEAASNVVDHAYAPATTDDLTTDDAGSDDVIELTFWTEDQTICFEIVDHGRWQPPDPTISARCTGFAIMIQLVPTVLDHYDVRGTRVLLRGAV